METAILLYKEPEGIFVTPMNSLEIWGGCYTPVIICDQTMEVVDLSVTEGCGGNYFDFCSVYSDTLGQFFKSRGTRFVITFHPEKTVELLFSHGRTSLDVSVTNFLNLFYQKPNIVTLTEREQFNLSMVENLTNCHGNPVLATTLFTRLIV